MRRIARRIALGAAITALAVTITVGHLDAAPPSNAPATAVLSDAGDMTILSDGRGGYTEGTDCVRSWFNTSKGNYYFRTVSASEDTCPAGLPENPRFIRLDLTQRVAGCGGVSDGSDPLDPNYLYPCAVNVVPDARLIADYLFKAGSTTTPVTIHFDLYPNFVNSTAFMLTFIDPVSITPEGSSRKLGGTNLLAELKVRQVKGRKSTFVTVGQYYMSFEMTVTPD